ncbi:DUF1990 family protein [Kitasatospora aureofaciens]|uniref:DUF1990 family protein n=1 Tax=Kitasatospora aureofaciens TaxID=1894 RepID=UPI00325ADBFC
MAAPPSTSPGAPCSAGGCTAFSRPIAWWARLAGPLFPLLQRAFARRCGRVLAAIAADAA